jgi:hypothetical protein
MEELAKSLPEGTAANAKRDGRSRFAGITCALAGGMLSVIVVNPAVFHSNPQRILSDPTELFGLLILFAIGAGWDYALSEWWRRKINRQEEEDS